MTEQTLTLYSHPLSGHSHRVRLFLSQIELPHQLIDVDLMAGARKAPELLKLNRFGQVPVLVDGAWLRWVESLAGFAPFGKTAVGLQAAA